MDFKFVAFERLSEGDFDDAAFLCMDVQLRLIAMEYAASFVL